MQPHSKTSLMNHPPFLMHYLPPHSPFLNPKSYFWHGGGRYTTGSLLCACLLCTLWKRHVMKLLRVRFRDGKGTQGAFSLDVCQGKILPGMWTRRCGQTQLSGKMLPNYLSCLFFVPIFFSAHFFCNFLFQFTVL